jgi:RHS repeat-associated protein
MQMPGRSFKAGSGYRYGFNGKENDNDVKGEGNQQDYGMRIYDPRLGKFLSVDPLTKDFPWYTPYQFAGNTPIQAIDLDGEEEKHYTLTLNKNGSATLTNIPSKTKEYNEIPLWLRIITLGAGKSSYKVPSRAVVTYGSNTYKIGFANSITNQDKMGAFNEILKNPNTVDPDAFTSTFHNEDQDRAVGLFTFNVSFQNNAAMYGPLFTKAWYTPKEEYINEISATRQSINKKLSTYLLDETHPVGGSKAKWFKEALGFTKENMGDLAKQIIFDPKTAILQKNNGHGNLYQQIISIKGANGKTINTPFNWIIKNGSTTPELVGAIPVTKSK